jgi:hypothetical protein
VGRSAEEAEKDFKRSQVYEHLLSLQQSTLKGFDIDSYVSMNLIGSIDQVTELIDGYRQAGAAHLSGLLFVSNSVEDYLEQMQLFSESVMPRFQDKAPVA